MSNVIEVNFTPEFRTGVFLAIKYTGIKRTEAAMLADGLHPTFVKVLIRSIMGKEGW